MSKAVAKPFLKWAGGKSQLLKQFENYFPDELKKGKIKSYFEPFVGGGSVFFHIAQKYALENVYLGDINKELILTYRVIQKDVSGLIKILKKYSKKYLNLGESDRKFFYYDIRDRYNLQAEKTDYKKYSHHWRERVAQLIFLNKTCFNGLFRVNRQGEFNVPFGRYKNPKIIDENNLKRVSLLLQKSKIKTSDFTEIKKNVTENSFVYFDPPYRPISNTSNFTSYSTCIFNDDEQRRLAGLYKRLSLKGVKVMLSNSDPKNVDEKDNFFDILYKDYHIYRVPARRLINSKADRRGQINELIITNY